VSKITVNGNKGGKKMYRELLGEMVKKGVSKKVLAEKIGVTEKTLFNKLNGKTDFTWSEVKTIRKIVSPEIPLEELFKSTNMRC